MSKKLWVIKIDETPEPWEDYSYVYAVVRGTKEQANEYCKWINDKEPEWLVWAAEVYGQSEVIQL